MGTQLVIPAAHGLVRAGPGVEGWRCQPVCPYSLVPAAQTPHSALCSWLPLDHLPPDLTLPTANHTANHTSPLAPPPGSCSQPAPNSPDPTDPTALWDTPSLASCVLRDGEGLVFPSGLGPRPSLVSEETGEGGLAVLG